MMAQLTKSRTLSQPLLYNEYDDSDDDGEKNERKKNLQNPGRCYHSLDPKEPPQFQVSPPRLPREELFDRPENILILKH